MKISYKKQNDITYLNFYNEQPHHSRLAFYNELSEKRSSDYITCGVSLLYNPQPPSTHKIYWLNAENHSNLHDIQPKAHLQNKKMFFELT